jgi:hypothetical protein
VTLSELLAELKSAGLLDRATRVKCADVEVDLSSQVDTEPKTMRVELPQHGIGMSENESKNREESDLLGGLYGAAQGAIPSYGTE